MREKLLLMMLLCLTTFYSFSQVGIGTTNPTEELDVVGNVKISGAIMPNNNAGTSGQILTSGGENNAAVWKGSPYRNAEAAVLTVAAGATGTHAIGIENNFNDAFKLIVKSTNVCAIVMIDEFLFAGSNAGNTWSISPTNGLTSGATTNFSQIDNKTIEVTRSGLADCISDGNSTSYNYTINVNLGVVSITNNGDVTKDYSIRLVSY